MAGMFYSLQEAAEKLNKTEQEVKQIVKDGELREFRDGQNLLFKVDEVEALMSDTSIAESKELSKPSEQPPDQGDILLVEPSDEKPPPEAELTKADTAVSGEGTSVLGETGGDTVSAEDTIAEAKTESGEPSLEQIEEDVNLDSFGSGSGLLDLSLQADDTSLGGILDEIYAPENQQAQEVASAGSAMEVAAEAEQMLPEEQFTAAPSAAEVSALAGAYVEPQPDTISNAFGIILFLPLLAVIYTAIVVVAGFNNVMPNILTATQNLTWYIMGTAAAAAGLIIAIAFILTSRGEKAGKKRKKAKKEVAQPAQRPD